MAMHPYHPSSLLLPDFVPIEYSPGRITGVFSAFFVVSFALCWKLSGTYKHLGRVDRLLVGWFANTGVVYIFLKGYWVFTPDFYKLHPSNALTRFFNEFLISQISEFRKFVNIFILFTYLGKEYGKGDSRYPARFSTLVVIEGFTAVVEGPASLLATYAILYKKPYAHPLQFGVSLFKFYGGILYFTTAYLARTGFHVRGPLYFWGYFVAVKGIFPVISFLIVCRSWMYLVEAFASNNSSARDSLEKKHV